MSSYFSDAGAQFRASYEKFKKARVERDRRTAVERSVLCQMPFLPSFVSERMGGPARRSLRHAIHQKVIQVPIGTDIRVYMETGVELHIAPLQDGLHATAIYHQHPWLSEGRVTHSVLFDEIIPWAKALNPDLSSHAKIAWIGKLPKSPVFSDTIRVDMSGVDSVYLDLGTCQIFPMRIDGLGLTVACRPRSTGSFTKTPSFLPAALAPGAVSKKIVDLRAQTDAAFKNLPFWKQVLLGGASDLGLLLHLLTDSAVQSACLLKHSINNRKHS